MVKDGDDPTLKISKYKEIRLQIAEPTLDELGNMLMMRKMTGNDIGIDYEFGVLVYTSILKGKEAVFIGPKPKKKRK